MSLIVSYCTQGPYEKEAAKLKVSLDKLRLFYEIKTIASLGDWQRNCLYKPVFIKEMLQKYDLPVLYVDADAVFHRVPDRVFGMSADFAVHYWKGTQLASGTLFFNNTAPARLLLDAWIEYNRLHPQDPDQANLQAVLEHPGWTIRLKIHLLPEEYCKIFDLSKNVNDPVIEHFQASRRLRC